MKAAAAQLFRNNKKSRNSHTSIMKEFLRTLVYSKCISRSIANNTVKAPLKGGLQFCTTTKLTATYYTKNLR